MLNCDIFCSLENYTEQKSPRPKNICAVTNEPLKSCANLKNLEKTEICRVFRGPSNFKKSVGRKHCIFMDFCHLLRSYTEVNFTSFKIRPVY